MSADATAPRALDPPEPGDAGASRTSAPTDAIRPGTLLPRALRIAVVLGLVALVVVLALSFRRDPRDIRTGTVGRPAPAFDVEALDGNGRVRLADHAGKVVVVNFFASWCIPCKEEFVALARTWERYRKADVVIIGILYQDDRTAGLDFQRRLGGTWPTAFDEDGRVALSFGVFGIPETFFIGPDGVIRGRHIGQIDEGTLRAGIESLRRGTSRP